MKDFKRFQVHYPHRETGYIYDEKSAELMKYAANAFLATKITYEQAAQSVNWLSDADMVRKGIGSDERIGVDSASQVLVWRKAQKDGRH
jgi:UDPglucose 6-dehydrogenase